MTPCCIFPRRLKERGGTALGPALLLSTALASKLPGSQVYYRTICAVQETTVSGVFARTGM